MGNSFEKVERLMSIIGLESKARCRCWTFTSRLASGRKLTLRRCPEGHWLEPKSKMVQRVLADMSKRTGMCIRSTDLHLVPEKCHSTCKRSASLLRTSSKLSVWIITRCSTSGEMSAEQDNEALQQENEALHPILKFDQQRENRERSEPDVSPENIGRL